MTITYTAEVATCRGLGCFFKILRRWHGSVYKLVWIDLILFLIIYYLLNITYRAILNEHQRIIFESAVKYCHEYSNLIPLSFVLGFYVTIVMTRWWNQYITIPLPDTIATLVSATVHGQDERGRVMRRTIMRYVCLCLTMLFTMIAPRVKRRFPTLDHFVESGLMQQNEKEVLAEFIAKFPKYSKHWVPIIWAASIVTRARKEGRIRDDFAVKTILDELNKFRSQCGLLIRYDNISIPLVYTQVVTLAVYTYFLTSLMGQQWIGSKPYKFDLYFPVFTTLQFFFYVGWLKVAETLINPFGDDDDDFEVNWMIDRNLQMSYLIVDEMHHTHPELVRDQYWDEVFPAELPYPNDTASFRDQHPLPSTDHITSEYYTVPTTPKFDDFPEDGIHKPFIFTARRSSISPSQGTMSRNNSGSSLLKRLFTRDDNKSDSKKSSTFELSKSSGSLQAKAQSVRCLVKDVIQEVDEHLATVSEKSHQLRPTIFDDSPKPHKKKKTGEPDDNDNISIGSATDASDDEFTKLKSSRQQERRQRMMLHLEKSLVNVSVPQIDLVSLVPERRRRSSTISTPTQTAFLQEQKL